MVHELIRSFQLLDSLDIVTPIEASEDDLKLFHSSYYLNYLKAECNDGGTGDSEESSDSDVDDEQLEYGLGYDCPKFKNLYTFVRTIAGASISAADELLNGRKLAINWCGGWHHAQRFLFHLKSHGFFYQHILFPHFRDEAEGFCYVNDIVIAIQKLLTKFRRILYIDLDIHHGNGVENAFAYSQRVFTVSFHQHEIGFYPGSGSVDDCGFGNGKGLAANFPYKRHIRGEIFVKYFIK